MLRRFLLCCLPAIVVVTLPAVAAGRTATVLELGHSLPAGEQAWLERLVERFNGGQRTVEVRLVAHDADRKPPTLALLDRATAAAGGDKAFRPLHQVMREAGQRLGALAPEAAVSDARGRPLALPIAQSTPVLLYNKAAFRAAGLDSEHAPATWFEVQQAADKLFDAGSRCPFTSSRPSEMLIEQTSLWHGEPLFGPTRQPLFNSLLQIKHVALMASWVKSRFFVLFGRDDEADRHFASGECGMITSASHLFPVFRKAGIEVGVVRLPIHDGYRGAPKNTVADGLALWIGEGRSQAEYRAAARFVAFLASAETQVELVRVGGFLPFAAAGVAAVGSRLTTLEAPQQAIALAQVRGSRAGAQLPRLPWVRSVIDEELEAVWADRKPAKAALDAAVARITARPLALAGGD